MSSESPPRRPRWMVVLIVLLPAWLIVSGVVAVWMSVHKEKNPEVEAPKLLVQAVTGETVADDLRKLASWIGERNTAGEDAARGLTRTAGWIEGSLGPGNVGHEVRKVRGPSDWPLLHVVQAGGDPSAPAQWVVAGYDSRPGSPGIEANATGVASVIAACRALAGETTRAGIHYLFLPHVHDTDAPVLETLASAAELIRSHGEPGRVMCVEATGRGGPLWISSRDTALAPEPLVTGIAEIKGAEVVCLGDDTDLASMLFEMGLPALRVSSRPLVTADEDDSAPADAARVTAASGLLVQWIRRCAGNP